MLKASASYTTTFALENELPNIQPVLKG